MAKIIAYELVKEVAKKTDDVAGDGTTTATVLAQSLVHEGLKNVTAGSNPIALRRGIEKASEAIVKELIAAAKDVETKDQIAATATISAADPEVGLDLDFTEGMRFDKGYIAPYFVTNAEDQTAVLEEPYILLTSGKVSSQQDVVHIAELVMKTGKPLLIIAEDVDGEALPTLILNNIRGTFKSCAVKARHVRARHRQEGHRLQGRDHHRGRRRLQGRRGCPRGSDPCRNRQHRFRLRS